MAFTINRKFAGAAIDEIDARTRAALADNGFGVLTEIDVQATLKKKIGEDITPYKILGACNPTMAFHAIGIEPRIGAMLPCNVIIRGIPDGVEVSAVDPVASMQGVENAQLTDVAGEVRDMLAKVIDQI